MTADLMTGVDLLVTGIGVVSPRSRDAAKAARSEPVPAWDGWFDHQAELGRRGYKYLPPPAHHLLAAAKAAMADAGGAPESVVDTARGVVIGTNSAVSALHADMDTTVVETSSDDISPAFAPFFSINLIGSRLAPEHQLRGFNVTVTSPRVAGLEALELGARAVALGRAQWLLAGVTEAPVDAVEAPPSQGEVGAVTLVLEPAHHVRARGGRAYGRCRVRTFFLPPNEVDRDDVVAELVAGALDALGGPVGETRFVLDSSPVGRAVARALGADERTGHPGAGALEPLLQVAGALAEGVPTLVVTAAPTGNVGIAAITKGTV